MLPYEPPGQLYEYETANQTRSNYQQKSQPNQRRGRLFILYYFILFLVNFKTRISKRFSSFNLYY